MGKSDERLANLNIALKPLTTPSTFKYGTWDVEASEWWNLVVIGLYDGERFFHFRNVGDFVNHILRKEYGYYRWFAHFGGRYDTNFVFDYLRDYIRNHSDLDVSFHCSGSMVMQLTIRRSKNCVATLCDSYRLLPGSLRGLCKAFGVKHQKTEIDYDNVVFNRQLLEYNENDCIGLHEVLTAFFEETGVMSETFASHALKVFRKEFLEIDLWKPHRKVEEFVRSSYHGGRVEVIKRKHDNVKAYDVNSMYPHVMMNPVPVRFLYQQRKLKEEPFGFIHARVYVPDIYIPPLPVRLDKLFFPKGWIDGIWTNHELIEAEKRGVRISRIHQAYYFEDYALFQGYVKKLYKLKQRATEPSRTIAKFLLNSLYGKFGQTPMKKVYATELDAPLGSTPIIHPDGTPSGFAYWERYSHAAYILPHLASAVTSMARIVLIKQLDERSFYCDTDSVFTTGTMKTGNKLGDWDLVGVGEAEFYQPKLYRFNGTWKAKGLNRKEDINAFVNGHPNLVTRHRSVKEAMRSGQPATSSVTVEKRINKGYKPKRAWDGDNDTRPWNVEELRK